MKKFDFYQKLQGLLPCANILVDQLKILKKHSRCIECFYYAYITPLKLMNSDRVNATFMSNINFVNSDK